MNGPATVADHLDGQIGSILSAWKDAVRGEDAAPRARSLTHAEFIDHVPELLDRLADRLRGRPADVSDAAESHGLLRWRQGYDLGELMAELAQLRAVLTRATFDCAREHSLGPGGLEAALVAIGEVLDEAIADSVREHQDAARSQAESDQVEADRQRAAVEAERSTAEAARLRLKTVLAHLPVGVWVADADGNIVSINREGERLQGFPAAETIGRVNVRDLTPEYDLRELDGRPLRPEQLPLSRALRGEVVNQAEFAWHLGGQRRIVSANAAPLTDIRNRIAGAVVVIQDITARKRLDADLAITSAQLKSIVEQSPVMMWRADPEGRCDFLNQTWLEFRGRTLEQEVDDGWVSGVHPEDRPGAVATYHDAVARREPFEMAYRLRRHDGDYRWVTDRGAPYFAPDGTHLGFLGSCLDIHERIDLEDALEQQRRRAEEASEHKSRLLSTLSHDARTPLNAVFLSAQLLEMHARKLPDPEVQECLRTIRHSVRNVLDLLTDLLDLTRLDAGADATAVSRFPIEPVMAECFSSIEPQARQKGLDAQLDPNGLTGLVVESDRAKLKQILSNLLSNALRFTESGHVRLFGEREGGRLKIAVEDTGVGIAPEHLPRIFDEFARLSDTHRQAGEGTGLGLAICRRLAGLLGGAIRVDSAPGRGSTFTIDLPDSAVVAEADPAHRPAEAGPADGPADDVGPILIVEDHPTSRRALGRVLSRLGYAVAEADNGRDALELARARRPLAVLMDVNMPIMNGIDATLALRADPALRDVPIFALTGDVSVINQRRIGEAGVNGYLEKPVTVEALNRALASLAAPTQPPPNGVG